MFSINFSSLLISFGAAGLTVAIFLHFKIRRLTGSQLRHLYPLRSAYSLIGFAAMLFGLMIRFDSLYSASPAEIFWNAMKILISVVCLFCFANGIVKGLGQEDNPLGARYYFLLAFVSLSVCGCLTFSFF